MIKSELSLEKLDLEALKFFNFLLPFAKNVHGVGGLIFTFHRSPYFHSFGYLKFYATDMISSSSEKMVPAIASHFWE